MDGGFATNPQGFGRIMGRTSGLGIMTMDGGNFGMRKLAAFAASFGASAAVLPGRTALLGGLLLLISP
jgi:hypothetical protein